MQQSGRQSTAHLASGPLGSLGLDSNTGGARGEERQPDHSLWVFNSLRAASSSCEVGEPLAHGPPDLDLPRPLSCNPAGPLSGSQHSKLNTSGCGCPYAQWGLAVGQCEAARHVIQLCGVTGQRHILLAVINKRGPLRKRTPQSLQYSFCFKNLMNSMKRRKDMTPEWGLIKVGRCPICYWAVVEKQLQKNEREWAKAETSLTRMCLVAAKTSAKNNIGIGTWMLGSESR